MPECVGNSPLNLIKNHITARAITLPTYPNLVLYGVRTSGYASHETGAKLAAIPKQKATNVKVNGVVIRTQNRKAQICQWGIR